MNENIDLTKILKDCPEGFKLYTPLLGEVEFKGICSDEKYHILVSYRGGESQSEFTKEGFYYTIKGAECLLFPSKDQRDWSKFTAPWYKNEKFDPTTLNPFDKVLVRVSDESYTTWYADFVAEPAHTKNETPLILGVKEANMVIPYNDDTKHLVGTNEEAPELYRYWE